MLLQEDGKVLADLRPHIQEGYHYQGDPDKAEGGLLPGVTHPTTETTTLFNGARETTPSEDLIS